jgi:hypothetical protein
MPLLNVSPGLSQEIKIDAPVYTGHPRLQAGKNKEALLHSVLTGINAKRILVQAKQQIDEHVNRHQSDPSWIVSRLQMFWKTKSSNIFIKGGEYYHSTGTAPVPTVKFPGARNQVTIYGAPALEDIQPYMDDPRGIYLIDRSKPDHPMEWAEISRTGRIIENINVRIMEMAYTAAVLYWLKGDKKYAKFALDLFNTYMVGMQHRNAPIDITHDHHDTLAGLSGFEVIQETPLLNCLTGIYDYLYDYLLANVPGNMCLYTDVFKKWADIQIAHGTASGNWNLVQAKNVLNIALILDDDKLYNDGKGNRYYTNYILNTSSERQWALKKFVNEAYDPGTGLWNESPGYSIAILNDFVWFIDFFDRYYNLDLVAELPVLAKAVLSGAQYLFPNGNLSSFGDSHYGPLGLDAAYRMVANARKNKKPAQELLFSRYIKTLQQFYRDRGWKDVEKAGEAGRNINSLLYRQKDFNLNDKIPAACIKEYVSPLLYSPHANYLVLRNGMHPKDGLMMVMSGSNGNQMGAGGISMEIYGKGFVLGSEIGIGGLHGFDIKSAYPASGATSIHFPFVSFAHVHSPERAAQANEERLTSIIRTGDSTGYYIDLFYSPRQDGKDKLQDYFYQNLGHLLTLFDNNGSEMPLRLTAKLSFDSSQPSAYDYFYDKRYIKTDKDFNAVFTLILLDHETIEMNMWMKGEEGREIFAVRSLRSKANNRMGLPGAIVELPVRGIIARQTGEVGKKSFAAVFEPSSHSQSRSIDTIQSFEPVNASPSFTGLQINGRKGDKQFIFSDWEMKTAVTYDQKFFHGIYGVIGEWGEELQLLFLGNGTRINSGGYDITSKTGNSSATLDRRKDGWYISCSAPIQLSIPIFAFSNNETYELIIDKKGYKGTKSVLDHIPVIVFDLPALPYTKMELK